MFLEKFNLLRLSMFLYPIKGFFSETTYFVGRWAKILTQIFFYIFFHTPKIMLCHFEELKVTLAVSKSHKK